MALFNGNTGDHLDQFSRAYKFSWTVGAGVDGIPNGKQVNLPSDEGIYPARQYVGDETLDGLRCLLLLRQILMDRWCPMEKSYSKSQIFIQWQYTGDTTWTNLVELTSLVGPAGQDGVDGINGKQVTFQVSEGFIQWQYVGDTTWTNLIDLQTITGADGSNGTDGADGRSLIPSRRWFYTVAIHRR